VGQGRVEGYCSQCEAGDPLQTIWENTLDSLIGVVECPDPDYAPAPLRIRAARALGDLGDPRVSTLPPAIVGIEGKKEFFIGIPEGQNRDEINEEPMTVSTFEIARYPITNAQYKLFIDDDGYNPEFPWWDKAGRAWRQKEKVQQPRYWDNERFGIARPNYPVVGISWYEAVAFCRWLTQHRGYNPDGYIYRLPTEAEWEYAARRDTRRTYPWGNEEPDGERTNFDNTYEGTTPVGCFLLGAADGKPGRIYDLAGNVWEWTGSIFKPYPYDPKDGREDTREPLKNRIVFRGGGWLYHTLHVSFRSHNLPDFQDYDLGFRPVRCLSKNKSSVCKRVCFFCA
jgi:formylglycine-generating enzyme required for sulfatase activity